MTSPTRPPTREDRAPRSTYDTSSESDSFMIWVGMAAVLIMLVITVLVFRHDQQRCEASGGTWLDGCTHTQENR